MQEFLAGLICGSLQSIIGHPLDTIKVLKQKNTPINLKIFPKLFNGLVPSVLSNSLITGIQFYSYKHHSFLVLPLISSILLTPFEYYKIQKQVNGEYKNVFPKGFTITYCREFLGLNSYFRFYDYLEPKYGPFLSGGLSGSFSWLISYPVDTIKTRIQSDDTLKIALAKGNFYNGLLFCLFRGFIVNGVGFYGASYIKF